MHAWAVRRARLPIGIRTPTSSRGTTLRRPLVYAGAPVPCRAAHVPSSPPPLWTRTLPRASYYAFVDEGVRLLARSTRSLEQVLVACVPVPSWLDSAYKREELQCVLLAAALRRRLPLRRLEQLCTVQAQPPEGVPLPILQFRRAMLWRAFMAQLEGQRFAAAAHLLGDARLQPSQTTYMLRKLLQALRTCSAATLLTGEQTQSPRAALREACEQLATLAQRRGALDKHVFMEMLRELSRRRMHALLAPWARVCAPVVHDSATLGPQLAQLVHRVATRHGAPSEAAMLVMALPLHCRTPAMLHTLLLHSDEPLGHDDLTPWKDAHDKPLAPALVAHLHTRLASLRQHASQAHAGAAWHEWRALQQLERVPDGLRTEAAFLVMQSLCAAGRVSLALRFAERRAPSVFHAHGTAVLTALLRSVLPAAEHLGQNERQALLSHMYECVLRGAAPPRHESTPNNSRALQLRGRMPCLHGPPTVPSEAVVHAILAHVSRLVNTYGLRPDLRTLQLLVRTAIQWNTTMDSRTLWHMAQLAMPRLPGPHSPTCRLLLRDLATALERRFDRTSARHARALARHSVRRVHRPASPHRPGAAAVASTGR